MTPTEPGSAYDEAYRTAQARLIGLISDEAAAVEIPSCPGWTGRDVAAHLTGVAEAWVHNDLDGYASRRWTQAQIKRRAGQSLDAVAGEWTALVDELLPIMRAPTTFGHPAFMPNIVFGDLVVHEHDVREALRARVPSDDEAVALALRGAIRRLERKLTKASAPALDLRPDELPGQRIGQGDALALVAGEPYELWRSLVGRRSRRQVEAFRWEGDKRPFIDHWLEWPFEWPEVDVVV
ncbi:MAG TPA: maleylpyruvate isomerase family mycothiol-dependent enzyme [Acidimicrobiales bacterium]|nr:maleylpyruvate isomerase family mycothiol-dependent enzyme [Acidimicrobiales bacterium]